MPGWPFWAATSDERIERAFDLAGLRSGERLLDLGCGDGRVLLRAAALRGAVVTGVELDPALAASARALLAEHGVVDATVLEGDFESVPMEADVIFAFLSPATLQRLRPRLEACIAGTRVVTTGYAVPGWEPAEAGGRCFLYRLPAISSPVDRSLRGWASPGVLVSVRPEAPALVAVKLHHGGGPVTVRVGGDDLQGLVTLRAGVDFAAAGEEVVVDARFEPAPAGTVAAGVLEADGVGGGSVGSLRFFAVVDPGEPGVWAMSAPGCDAVGAACSAGEPGRVQSLLRSARSAEPA